MKVAADANVLLAAVIGGRARLILSHPQITEIFTTESIIGEVQEYAPLLGAKKRLRADLLLLTVAALPVTVVGSREYAKSMPEAIKRIGRRDRDDADLLGLSLHFEVPIWSNDRDFEGVAMKVFTTETLLRHLAIIR